MPHGDGTGPLWAQNRYWRCWSSSEHSRGFKYRYWQRFAVAETCNLTKEEKKKILEEELKEIEKKKEAIENKLKESES